MERNIKYLQKYMASILAYRRKAGILKQSENKKSTLCTPLSGNVKPFQDTVKGITRRTGGCVVLENVSDNLQVLPYDKYLDRTHL